MIRILDSFIADKIAAGEVIERPVSAVKELIENSIDAEARSIIVEIRGGGSSYIRITDDGCGISYDEIETAFLRHATSKISKATDLDNIQSLGFRGEALASISAVSRLTIVSKTSYEQAGSKLILHAGRVIAKERIGANKGTTIVVEDIFYNTPARRKFMKSDAREASAIIELVQQYAICYSNIRFMMINNGKTLFSTAGRGDSEAAIKTLYPDAAHSSLISISGEGISGYISAPGTTLSSRKGQLFFVNGRLVHSKIVEKALTEGYGGRIFSGFPVAILFIEEDPHCIDVNIHPGKREILFLHADELSGRISKAVANAIDSEASVPQPDVRTSMLHTGASNTNSENNIKISLFSDEDSRKSQKIYEESGKGLFECSGDYSDSDVSEAFGFSNVAEQPTIKEYLSALKRDDSEDFSTKDGLKAEENQSAEKISKPFDFDNLLLKGYVFDTYIIMQKGDSLYVFDQHAAHERIFYERLLGVYNASERLSQPIISPIMLNVSADVYQMRDEILDIIGSLGYDISDFGSGSFIIRAIPSFMTAGEAEGFLKAFCESAEIEHSINDRIVEKIIMKSCKSAVKGGDRLSDIEINELMKTLSACSNPYSCPHGRPTFVKITRYDIEKSFKRI